MCTLPLVCVGRFLYFSPLREKLHKYKLNPNYPGFAQMKHDAIASTIASLCGACIEVVLCHYWATGALAGAIDPESGSALPLFGGESTHKTWLTIVWAITITHWRVPHFYFVHRVMHPWKCANFPDLGKYLYNWVHKQHHKSHNPTAFSGTNMVGRFWCWLRMHVAAAAAASAHATHDVTHLPLASCTLAHTSPSPSPNTHTHAICCCTTACC